MQAVTLGLAVLISILAMVLRPKYALAVYIISLLWYPDFLAMSIGTIDIPVSRAVVFVLLLRCLLNHHIRSQFIWSRLDTVIALSMVVYFVIPLFTFSLPFSEVLENRGGFLMDTWFAYLVTRFIITDRAKLITVIKCASIALVPLAILGVIECITHWQPFAPLRRFSPWYHEGQIIVSRSRFGLARALGPFSHAILFGCCFGIFLPFIYYLRHEKGPWRTWAYVISAIAFVGALSCVSSGGWIMASTVVFCLALEKHKIWAKRLLILFLLLCIFTGIASNRPFYHVIVTRLNPVAGAGWHRAKLIDLAIERFDEWWFTGYGGEDPGWGPVLGMAHTDLTNEFILAGVRYGVLGVIALCVVVVTAFRNVLYTYRRTKDPRLKSLCWSLGSLLLTTIVTWMSVSFFGQMMPLIYFVYGIIGSCFCFERMKRYRLKRMLKHSTSKPVLLSTREE